MRQQTNSVTAERLPIPRRNFLAIAASTVAGSSARALGETALAKSDDLLGSLQDEVGVTTSSFSRHLVARPGDKQFSLIDLPKIMRDDLDMRVIDLNTSSLGETSPAWLDKVRHAVDKAGCVMINLKMNQQGLDMNSPDRDIRNKALTVYRKSIDAASHLGIPWARPLPLKPTPDMKIHVDSYRELADYGADKNVRMLVENYAWMESDPQSVVKLIAAIDRDVAACPDTGNWANNETRYAGLALSKTGEHPLYDLKRCFDIGTAAEFRGPWCLEHANADRDILFRELALVRDMLRGWIKEASAH
jgi:hypothetical protein